MRPFGFLARFLAGGMAVSAAPAQSSPAIPRPSTGWLDRLEPGNGNIALWAGLMLIPLVAATGFASDRELQIGPRLRDAAAVILHLPGPDASSRS